MKFPLIYSSDDSVFLAPPKLFLKLGNLGLKGLTGPNFHSRVKFSRSKIKLGTMDLYEVPKMTKIQSLKQYQNQFCPLFRKTGRERAHLLEKKELKAIFHAAGGQLGLMAHS